MSKVWTITGAPGVGKSTVVGKVVFRLRSAGVIVGGCTTVEKRVKGVRVGFDIRDLTEGRTGELASVNAKLGPKVGKYRVNLVDLTRVAAAGLTKAAASSELIVIDEMGPLELVSPEFRRGVISCLDSGKPVLAVLHERIEDDLLNRLRTDAEESYEITIENRDSVVEALGTSLLKAVGGPKVSVGGS